MSGVCVLHFIFYKYVRLIYIVFEVVFRLVFDLPVLFPGWLGKRYAIKC